MSVRIVPADELFNEFSSGTPDANAYRRYLKMFYDRAGNNESLMPKSLLLFGDCAWDNRMKSSAWNNYSTDDFLLCFESENSFSSTDCYVNDGFFCSLDDGEGGDPAGSDKHDIAVGRFPVRTAEEAKIMVDKTIAYAENKNAGSWQNVVMFMGDDGNDNLHMADANEAAAMVEELNPGLVIKRVMWDAYTEVATSTGNTYPEVASIIKQQQANGALVMDYCGHGSQGQISHEGVLHLSDFKNFPNTNLPLWITASCDIAPFDSQTENIGEETVLSDATDQVVGRLCSKVAKLIRGKYKPSFTPHVDCGDNVIIINAAKVVFTGKKETDKVYTRYTGYPGGQRFNTPEQLRKRPNGVDKMIRHAVKGMLPKGRLKWNHA